MKFQIAMGIHNLLLYFVFTTSIFGAAISTDADGNDANCLDPDVSLLGDAISCFKPNMFSAFKERGLGKEDNEDVCYRIFSGMDTQTPTLVKWYYKGPETVDSIMAFKQIERDAGSGKWRLIAFKTIQLSKKQHELLKRSFDGAGLSRLVCSDWIPAAVRPDSSSWVYELPAIGGCRIMVRRLPDLFADENQLSRANVTMNRYNRELNLRSLTLMLLTIAYSNADQLMHSTNEKPNSSNGSPAGEEQPSSNSSSAPCHPQKDDPPSKPGPAPK